MNVLVLLLVVSVSVALGMASLENSIVTNAQDLGVAEESIDSQIDASLILVVERTGPDFDVNYKDVIVSCKFTNEGPNTIPSGSTIYCKLLDVLGNVIAEGSIVLDNDLAVDDFVDIPIEDVEFVNANNIENVDQIIFVIQGPSP